MKYTYVIVDDDEAFVTLLKHQLSFFDDLEFLESYGRTISAATGIERLKPDIIFLDMEVDILTGLDILKVVHPKSKIIVISNSMAYQEEADALGVHDYIQKPIESLDRLRESVDRIATS
ncbi:LytTR family DNA-binding domain-containing protein [Marinoscillum sp. MHG1-6]|uniref:LytR/AlgR family response regulator transcription factor n=1 Tax=Marinoscillum sp. MHG1-6 TaxID=2959627 RepID=UPI00215749BF|nr:response regulator [Marinoscillum sp. MHG1-6]